MLPDATAMAENCFSTAHLLHHLSQVENKEKNGYSSILYSSSKLVLLRAGKLTLPPWRGSLPYQTVAGLAGSRRGGGSSRKSSDARLTRLIPNIYTSFLLFSSYGSKEYTIPIHHTASLIPVATSPCLATTRVMHLCLLNPTALWSRYSSMITPTKSTVLLPVLMRRRMRGSPMAEPKAHI